MPDDSVPAAAPVTPAPVVKDAPAAAATATPAPVVSKDAPAPAAAVPDKKPTLLGDDPDAKPAEGDKPDADPAKEGDAVGIPEKYEVKVPEGMNIDAALLEAVTPVMKELKISQEGFQKLVDAYAPVIAKASQAQHEAAMKAFDEQIETWGKQTREMLGPDAGKAMAPASRLINTFAGKDATALRQLLNDTGLGNHPLMVKFMINAGKAISQDKFVDGGNHVADNTEEAVKGRMYPSMKK